MHPVQIALQSGVSSRKLQRMSTAKQTTSKLAKNWPSRVFRVIRAQVVEVQIPLYFQGFPCWWAQQDLNLRPNDYECSALTIELQAHDARVAEAIATFNSRAEKSMHSPALRLKPAV